MRYFKNNNSLSMIKHCLAYAGGSFFLKTISLIIVPLNLRKLTPNDYGVYSLILSFISIASTIIGLGLRQVISLEYFHCTNWQQKNQLIGSILGLYISVAMPIILLLYVLHSSIIHVVFFDTISTHSFIWILLIIFLTFFSDLFFQLLQYNQLVYQVIGIQIAIALLVNMCTILFVWWLNLNYTGIILAHLIGLCVSCSVTLFKCIKHKLVSFIDFGNIIDHAKYYLPYGFPFIPRILFSWVLLASDKWILGYYCSMHEVGIYAVADLFAQIFYALIIIPWESAYIPYIMKQYKQNQLIINSVEKQNKRIMYSTIIVLFVAITCGFFLCKTVIAFIIPPNYAQAINHILILTLGQLLLLASNFASTIIQFYKRTYILLFILAIPAISNIILNLILIPHYGLYGATIATFISFGIYWALTLYMNRQTRMMFWHTAYPVQIPPLVSNQADPLS